MTDRIKQAEPAVALASPPQGLPAHAGATVGGHARTACFELARARAEPPERGTSFSAPPPAAILLKISDTRCPTFRGALHDDQTGYVSEINGRPGQESSEKRCCAVEPEHQLVLVWPYRALQ